MKMMPETPPIKRKNPFAYSAIPVAVRYYSSNAAQVKWAIISACCTHAHVSVNTQTGYFTVFHTS